MIFCIVGPCDSINFLFAQLVQQKKKRTDFLLNSPLPDHITVIKILIQLRIMMAEVLPSMHGQLGQMDQGKGHMGMPQYWAPPDERDAYIGWLKSEFAAANALIDSMCHHMHNIGDPGEYDTVFGCLNKRRHAWTHSLYMQHFFSVTEVVNALQEVAWKKHQGHRLSSIANAAPKDCTSTQAQAEEAHDKAQLGSIQRSNTHLNLTDNSVAKSQQSEQVTSQLHHIHESTADLVELERIECFSTSNNDVNGSHLKATPETGEVETSHSPNSALSTSAEFSITECDKKTSSIAHERSSTTQICNSGEQTISAKLTKGLDVKKLLNIEVSIASKEEDARHAMIKRSMQFQCCEHEDGQMINDGESVELCESIFNSKEVDEIIEIICQFQAAGRQGELGCAFRSCTKSSCLPDIIQFGPKLGDATKTNDNQCIPKFLQAIIKWLTWCGILSPKRRPDSCLISIFDEGNFEPPNTDQGAWEKPLCVISLMGDCTMVFGHSITTDQHGSCKGPFQVALPAGSVLLLRENFAGILQKAIPASPSRRITIALGKAISTSIAELSCVNAAGKVKNKHWGKGGENQARLLPNPGVLSHRRLPHMQFPFVSMQPNYPGGLMLPHPTVVLPRVLGSSTAGTGVFFPPCDAGVSVPTSWQSGVLLLSSTSLVAPSRSVHSKRAEKHVGVKGSFDLTDMKAPKEKLGKVAPCQVVDGDFDH